MAPPYTPDPWVVREVNRALAAYLDGPTPPAEYAVLSEGQKGVYRQQFSDTLYQDSALNKKAHAKRVGYFQTMATDCRTLLPLLTKSENVRNANILMGIDASSRSSSEMREDVGNICNLFSYLQKLKKTNKTKVKVQEEVEEVVDKSLTEMQRFIQNAAGRGEADYAKFIGKRIRRYDEALAQGTPTSIALAQNLWRELRGSLAGWVMGAESVGSQTPTQFIKQHQSAKTDPNLTAFAVSGYEPVEKDEANVNALWQGEMPDILKEWRADWPLAIPRLPTTGKRVVLLVEGKDAGKTSPSQVAQWLYDARVGRLELQTLLAVYEPKDQGAVAYHLFQAITPSYWALDSSNAQRPAFNMMVPGRDFFSGPLSQRMKRIEVAKDSYNAAQNALSEEGKPQDTLIGLKLPAVEHALGFLDKKVQTEGEGWGAISSKTSPRDPWIPLNVISAFVSYKCQLPFAEWAPFFLHPQGQSLRDASWWTSVYVRGAYDTQSREDTRKAIAQNQVGLESWQAREVQLNKYDPMVDASKAVQPKNVEWPSPYTLSNITNFSPWRLEVIRLGPQAQYAYRTFDWFPHSLQGGDTVDTLIDKYKIPGESREDFLQQLAEENSSSEWESFLDGTITAAELDEKVASNRRIAVPRIVPMYFLLRGGDSTNRVPIVKIPQLPIYFVGDVTPTTVGENTTLYMTGIPAKMIRKLRQGISPISRLFLFYINNDYRVFTQRLASLLWDTKISYKALSGEAWGEGISPPRTQNEETKKGNPNPKYLSPGDWATAQAEYSDYVNRFRNLYRVRWSGSQYVNIEKEVPLDEEKQIEAQDEAYEGTVNPTFIPQTGKTKDRIFTDRYSPENYHIGQGFICRITRRRQSSEGRLSSIERAAGVEEPDTRLVMLGKELKRTFQQQRISLFQELVEKTFIGWMEEEGKTGAVRKTYQKSIADAYNGAWSGFFTPDRVKESSEVLGPFAPAYKYNTVRRLGYRQDLGDDPKTGAPYPYQVSDLVSRWNPKAVARIGSPVQNKSLYPYQSNAVWKLLDNNGGLLAFDVGVGKTITALAAAGMLKQQGKATRTAFLVPKSIKLKWWKDMRENFPDWRVAVFGKKIGFPTGRSELPKERQGEFDRIFAAVINKTGLPKRIRRLSMTRQDRLP